MRDLLPFIVSACGLLWVFVGAWGLFTCYRSSRQARPAAETLSESSDASTAKARRRLQRRRLGSFFWLITGIATLCFSGIRIGTPPAALSMPQEEKSRLAEIVTQHVVRDFAQRPRIGMVVGAVANNEEILLGFGSRQLGDWRPPDADTVFEIGSISKVFTGILLAKRVENGELKLDDRIADLLPEGWSLSEAARATTLLHCTTHTSGLPRLPDGLKSITRTGRALFGGDPYRSYSEDRFRDALATVELEFEPGAESRYSNFGVGLLGFALANQNGSDYETLVKSEIFQPLGMHRTGITTDQWQLEHMPAGYRGTLQLGPTLVALESSDWQLPNHLAGAGAIRSTGSDMMTFLKANMGVIPTALDAAIRRSHQELYNKQDDRSVGMNWMRSYERGISQNIIWHNGGTGGFRTYVGFTEDRQFGVVALSNTAMGVDELAVALIRALVRDSDLGG